MAEAEETRVLYKAIADFSELARKTREARKELRELKAEEAALNASSARGSDTATRASRRRVAAAHEEADAVQDVAEAAEEAADATEDHARASEHAADATRRSVRASRAQGDSISFLNRLLSQARTRCDAFNSTLDRTSSSQRRNRNESNALGRTFDQVQRQATSLNRSLNRLGNWRPRLRPPFIALIPIIAAVLALINPLVAGLGAVGAAAFGMGSSIASIAGAALSVVPALMTLLSVVGALKMAFGGIGKVFKANTAMKDAQQNAGVSAGDDNRVELTRAEQLERAWERYRRTIQDVQYAQEDLSEAREGYTKRIEEMRRAVERAALSEARAAADAQLARENYANILADPGSTKGQKMEAAASLEEAKAAIVDVREENRTNAKELAKAQATGVDGDRDVILAKRRVTDAINAQRDAYIDIQNVGRETETGTLAAARAVNEYQDALNELSPSARATVLALLGMSDAWKTVRRNVQEAFFREVVDDIQLLRRLFPSLESMLTATATAMGKVADAGLRLVTSDEWLKDIEALGPQNAEIIASLGAAFLYVLDIIRDLTIAVGPFAQGLADGMRDGAANMAELVSTSRDTGRLANWLETVNERMGQWWRIVKNIGATLFNFGAAAGDFGQWITDAFENVTEGWLEASRSSREEGSTFKKYLEDIKPLLSEVGGLMGDFFQWFGEESADETNINTMTDLVKILREDLGPAFSGILETLTDSGIAQQFFDALASVLEAVQTFLDNGGAEGIGAFWKVAEVFFEAISDLIASTPAPVIQAIATAFGVLAALKFFGLLKVLGLMLALVNHRNLRGLLGGIARAAGGALGVGAGAAAAGGAGVGAGAAAAGAAAGATRRSIRDAERRAARGSRIVGGAKGGIAGLAAAIAAELLKDEQGGTRDTAGSLLGGAATGAGVGALVGSVVPGVGTAAGAVVGGVVGTGAAAAGVDTSQWRTTAEEMGRSWDRDVIKPFNEANDNVENWWTENVTKPFKAKAGEIGDWWRREVIQPFNQANDNIERWWRENVVTPFSAFGSAMGRGWDQLVVQPLSQAGENISRWWNESVVRTFTDAGDRVSRWWNESVVTNWQIAANNVSTWWNESVVKTFTDAGNRVSRWWNENVVTNWQIAADNVSRWWNDNVVRTFTDAGERVSRWWNENVVTNWQIAANNVSTWWNDNVVRTFTDAGDRVSRWWNESVITTFQIAGNNISTWWNESVVARWVSIADGIGTWWQNNVTDKWESATTGISEFVAKMKKIDFSDALTDFFSGMFRGDGPGANAPGAKGGSTLEKVKNVLPRGATVTSTYRTPAQNRAVGGVPGSYHTDKKNPAVDIAGSVPVMDAVYARLRAIGGWRELLYKVRGHYDHVHVAHQGGIVSPSWHRSPGDKPDERTTRLQVGEAVVSKQLVPQFLAGRNVNRPKNSSFANNSGVAPTVIDQSVTVQQLIVQNPERETASDSLPRTIRKVAHMGAGKTNG